MKAFTVAVLALVCLVPRPTPAQVGSPGELLGPPQLDRLLAPVALYPDPLLGQVLMAATYPLEVVEAARWVQHPRNGGLRGDALAAALERQDWAPSVKSLVPFPQVLLLMDSQLAWMQQLGDAFLSQEADVMDSVQRLRRAALAAGGLRSTREQVVRVEGDLVVIEPATPQVIYVPVYRSYGVYGPWPYPAYPPVYLLWPSGYVFHATLVPGLFFSIGLSIVHPLWGWWSWDWHRHRIHLDVVRFNVINVRRPPQRADVWRHDPYHRRGVVYRDRRTRERFEPGRVVRSSPPREFRGFPQRQRGGLAVPSPPARATRPAPRVSAPPPRRPAPPPRASAPPPRASAPPPRASAPPPRASAPPPRGSAPPPRGSAPLPRGSAPPPRASAPPPRASVPAPRAAPAPRSRPPVGGLRVPRQPPTGAAGPPAFEGIGRGGEIRGESERGRASRRGSGDGAARRSPHPGRGGFDVRGHQRGGRHR